MTSAGVSQENNPARGSTGDRSPAKAGSSKLLFLESIRGLAAVVVLIHHFRLAFILDDSSDSKVIGPVIGPLLFDSPLRFLHFGPFAVRIFFVLSGFVLSVSFFQNGDRRALSSAAIRRYFRLMYPVFVSILIAWALIKCGFFWNGRAAAMSPAGSWLANFFDADSSLINAIKLGMLTTFFVPGEAVYPYLNPFLWTMSIELMGSYFVFGFLALCGSLPRRWLIYPAVIIGLIKVQNIFFIDFLSGLMLCDAFVTRQRQNRTFACPAWIAALFMFAGLLIGGASPEWLKVTLGFLPPAFPLLQTVGAALVVGGSLLSPALQQVLEAKPLAFLGKLSFPVYLIHYAVLCSITSWTFVRLQQGHQPMLLSLTVTGLVYFSVTLLAAWGLYYAADRPSIAFAKRLESWLLPKP